MRRWLCVGAVLAGCAAMAAMKDPAFVPPPSSTVQLTLRAFNTGSARTFRAVVVHGDSWFEKVTLDMPAFVLNHPTQGLIVFDTGLPPQIAQDPGRYMGRVNHFFAPFKQAKGQDLASQMRRAGYDPADVRWVIVSHRHFDHLGSLRAFPNATVVLSSMEWRAAQGLVADDKVRTPPPPERFQGLRALKLVDFSGAGPVGTFEHGVDLFGDGSVILLDASGHTSGSMAAFVRFGPEGTLLTGDASWTARNYEVPARQFYAWNRALHERRLWEIHEWKRRVPGLLVLPGHDLSPLRSAAWPGVLYE